MGVPPKLDGCKGKSHLEMDDLGVPPFQETTIFIGNNIIGDIFWNIQYPLLTLLMDTVAITNINY